MIVALGSVRGAPGVSAWSMLLAAAWPESCDVERIVLEVDVDGGVAAENRQLTDVLESYKLLPKIQSGFRFCHSTEW